MLDTAVLDGVTIAMTSREPSPATEPAFDVSNAGAALRAYVPAVVAAWPDSERRWRTVDGTLLFLDISGFTAFSELMARRGRQGAELVTDALNRVFGALLDVSAAEGGDLLKFGGDALLVLFTGEQHAQRGVRAAVAMRRALRRVGSKRSTGGVTLRASSGLASGEIYLLLAGKLYDELVIAGATLDAALDAEAAAESGEVLAHASTARMLPEDWQAPGRGEFVEITYVPRAAGKAQEAPGPVRDLARALPPAVAAAVSGGRSLGEHRLGAVGFVKFRGVAALIRDSGPEGLASALDELLTVAQWAAARQGLCLIATDVDHDGGKLIFTAGVPLALDDASGLAILAVLEVLERRLPLPLSGGVHSGRLFAGDVGSTSRRTFTVIGDTVNTAARVMSRAAKGEALVSIEALAATRTLFETSEPVSFAAKGKSALLVARAVRRPLGRRGEVEGKLPFAGRHHELAALRSALEAGSAGPSWIDITGDGGIGKSRLVEEFLAGLQDVPVFRAQTASYSRDIPYRALVPALRGAMAIPVEASRDEAGSLLAQAVRENAPALMPLLPLLAEPFDAAVRATAAAARIDPRFRMERQHAAVRELLAASLGERTLIVVEDRQWLDDASRGLLQAVAIQGGAFLVITSSRTVDGQPGEGAEVLQLPLPPLDSTSLRDIANAFAEATPIPPFVLEDAIRRCGGNPLFLVELLRDAPVADETLPDNIEQLIANRLDRLDATARRSLQELAVAGMTFDVEMAAAALAATPREAAQVLHLLGTFLDDEDGEYRFRDRLYQECAYRMMPFRVRREVHARIARFLEAESARATGGLLSFHWWEAGEDARAFALLEEAAAEAQARYANLDAAANYRRALAAAARLRGIPPERRRKLFESLGDALEMTGQFAAAEDAFDAAMRLSHGDPRLLLKRATIRERRGQYAGAVRLIRRGLRLASDSTPRDRAVEAELLTLLAGVRFRQGRLGDASAAARLAIDEAEAAGGGARLAHALYLLGHSERLRGNAEGDQHMLSALPLVEEAGALVLKANLLNNLGVQAYYGGDLEGAVAYWEESRKARDESGDVIGAATAQNNIGEALSDLGRLDDAEPLFRQALTTWRASGYPVGMAIATQNLGRLATRRGKFEEAHARLTDAASQFRAMGADDYVLQARTLVAENWLSAGDAEAAVQECEACAADADAADRTAALAALMVVRGQALAALKHVPEARAGLERAAMVARAAGAASQAAAAEAALAALATSSDEPDLAVSR